MSGYMVELEALRALTREIFLREGLEDYEAAAVVDELLDADARGVRSHGVIRIKEYTNKIMGGGALRNAPMEVVTETPVSAVLDAKGGIGAVAGQRAVELAREKALRNNVGMVSVKNSNHFGMAGHWSLMLAGQDMIGIACSNTQPSMPAPGSKSPCIGNNPFSFAFSAGARYPQVCVDMATSVAAWGKAHDYYLRGLPIPKEWGLDSEGNPTDDYAKYAMMAPFSGHKGFGIAFLVEVFATQLSGGALPFEMNSQGAPDLPELASQFYCAINVGAFRSRDAFQQSVARYIDHIHSLPMREEGTPAV